MAGIYLTHGDGEMITYLSILQHAFVDAAYSLQEIVKLFYLASSQKYLKLLFFGVGKK
jgi:hypothetical protein